MNNDRGEGTRATEGPIVKRKLSDQVFDRLREMLASGELAPGDIVPSERALMERFGVGRPAVREALQMLENKGLITISHGGRSRVNRLTSTVIFEQMDEIARLMLSADPENLGYLKQIRKILESATVRLAADNAGVEEVAKLRDLVSTQRSHLGRSERDFIQADIAFHVELASLTNNPLIRAVTEAMLRWLFEFHTPVLHWSGREETTLLEHGRIVDFIEVGDADGAVAMMMDHLNRSDPLYKPHHQTPGPNI